jgi:arsenate reductase
LERELQGKRINGKRNNKCYVENPILIERPIVVKNNKAVIGRPPENVLSLFV